MTTASQFSQIRDRFPCLLVLAALVVLLAQPAFAEPTPAKAGQHDALLTGAVYDSSGLPLIGALIALAPPGDQQPAAMTVSDQGGRFSLAADPGIYTLMARSFGFVSAIVPELQIPRAEPVRLQLRTERQVVSLLSDNAPLDIGWAFRPRVRDVLRYGEPTGAGTATKPVDDAWIQSLDDSSMWANVGGELSLWTVAPMDGDFEDSRSATDFSMGSVGSGSRSWMFKGQLADGIVRANSNMSRVVSDSHAMRLGIGFAGKELGVPDVEHAPRDMWVGSLSAEDFWRLGEAVQVGYGLHFEHYNYLEENGLVSPRVQIAFVPVKSVILTTGVSYNAEAPGLAELRFQVDPLAVRYMDVLSVENINPERTLRYELGVQSAVADTEWRARVFRDEIRDELVGIYLANESGSSDFLVANLGDAVTQGFEVDVRRSFMDSFAGVVSYAYGRRDGVPMPTDVAVERGMLRGGGDLDAAAVDVVHEVAAGVETVLGGYDTRLNATYHWQSGIPVVRGGSLESVYERLDLRVRQPLPFRALSSDWSALVQVQNVLGTSYDGVFDFGLGNAPVLSRLVSGGLAVRF